MNNDLHCEGNQHKHGGEVDGDYKESCKMSQIIWIYRCKKLGEFFLEFGNASLLNQVFWGGFDNSIIIFVSFI